MARWRLTNPHYLKVPGITWEYTETNRDTGRAQRASFPVPLLLDPKDSADHNYPGEIIVAHEGPNAQRRDIIFEGEPTPEMEPLDVEAEEITAALRPKWVHPIESLPGQGGDYSLSLLRVLESKIDEAIKGGKASMPASQSIDQAAFQELKAQFAELVEQNAKLQAQMAELALDKKSQPQAVRRA